VTSIGGNCSAGTCCACAAEMPSDMMGIRKLEASQERRCRVAGVEDMVQASV
jgi:hypothetical protein